MIANIGEMHKSLAERMSHIMKLTDDIKIKGVKL